MKKRLLLKGILTLLLSVIVSLNLQPLVFAQLSPEQRLMFQMGIKYYNVDDYGNCTEQVTTSFSNGGYNVPSEWGVKGKLAQMLMVSVSNDSQVQPLIDAHVGGVFLHGRQFTTADGPMLNKFTTSTVLPPIIAADEEGGKVQRIRDLNGPGTAAMPSAQTMGTWSNSSITAQAQKQALMLRSLGVQMAFAPVLDLAGGSSVIGGLERAFSADPNVVTDKAGTFAAGYRQTGVVPVFKHFPGHGYANGDSHVSAVTTPDLATLKSRDLKPYESLLRSGDSGVMVGHLSVPGLTDNGVPASLNPATYQLLRGQYGFQGVAMTDDIGSMQAIRAQYGVAQAASMAIQAGADMVLFVNENNVNQVLDQLVADNTSGKITNARIDESLARIGKLRSTFGLKTPSVQDSSTAGVAPRAGVDNRETTYNFFISKGMSPNIAAGFVGNLIQESGINPKSVNSIGATGIAQWLSAGRLKGLKAKPNYLDLMVQLEYIWEELNSTHKSAYDKILAATDLQSTTYAIRKWYEAPGEKEANDERRLKEATKALQEFGNGTGVIENSSSSSDYCAQGSTAAGQATRYIDGFTLYSQGDPDWASHPYGSSTIKDSGCGPSSVAMVVSTLTGQKVTPVDVADWGTQNGMYLKGDGSSWELFTKGPQNWGLKSQKIDASQIAKTLQDGGLIIASGTGSVPFSTNGHIIVLRAINEQGELLIGNPGNKASNDRSWPMEHVTSQARGFWAITK